MKSPYPFDEFFASGLEESVSPFLTHASRPWGENLSLKSAAGGACCLALAFAFSFGNQPLSSIFLALVYFLVGAPALLAAFDDLKNLEINIDVLMTLAAFVAVLVGSGLEGGLLLVLFELSHGMEDAVSKKAKSAIHHLHKITPKFAHVLDEDGTLYEKSIREITVGMKVLVKNGEIVPLDGIVIEGSSSVNLVHLTGESMPIFKQVSDPIAAGARNLESALLIEVNRISADSTLSRIIQLISLAQEGKPRLQSFLDRFGKKYASFVIGLTFALALSLPWLLSIPYLGLEGGVYRALAFLIAASPCALIIATPTAYLSAISACAKKGILLKGGIALDALASCKTIAFDKTGTLTTGDLAIASIEPLSPSPISTDEALAIAASLERHVVHPIATAICKFAQEKKLPLIQIDQIHPIPGSGIEGRALLPTGPIPVFIGLPEKLNLKQEKSHQGQILAALSIGEHLFLFRFIDQVRQEIPELLRKIHTVNGLKTVMLTGDHEENAQTVGRFLGIDEIYANLRPEDKLKKVEELSSKEGLAMIGDGINDAPALARATIGISMGRIGSATAIDASDIVLLNDDLHLLTYLLSKSHQTISIVKQNLTLAIGVILLATIPALLGYVPLWVAVLLHEGGTVLVGLNSLRLLK